MEQTASVLGIGRATVVRLQRSFRSITATPEVTQKTWGGRRRALLTLAEEEEFLRPWAEQAKKGGVLVLSPIRAALAQKLGRKVSRSVVWRFLGRHGWRKVAPDTRHPKSDPQVQEAWKKTSDGVGSLAEFGGSSGPAGAPDVSGRSAVRSHGAHSPLLVPVSAATAGGQRL